MEHWQITLHELECAPYQPIGTDSKIISGESGVATFAHVNAVLQDQHLRKKIGLDAKARVLVINTEGDTDEQVYQEIIKNN